jgi:hypothetical protein
MQDGDDDGRQSEPAPIVVADFVLLAKLIAAVERGPSHNRTNKSAGD